MEGQDRNQPIEEEDISRWDLPSLPNNSPPPPPPTPPPPPPTSPHESLRSDPSSYQSKPTVARLEKRSPRKNAKKKDRQQKVVEGGKKKRKKKKKSTNSNTKPPLGSYGQQYNSGGKVPPAISYHNDDPNHSNAAAPRIVNYSSPPKASGFGSIFSAFKRQDDNNDKAEDVDDTFIRNGNFDASLRINTGELNSAAGGGTTVPEVLGKSRILHVLHVLAVFVLEGFGLFWHVVSFQVERLLWGAALIFLASLLGCFEIVRGEATLADADRSLKFQDIVHIGNRSNRFGTQTLSSAESLIYKVVVTGPTRRKIREFLQRYAFILYSSIGRGIYLCVMGGVAWMHDEILMRLLSISFGCLGLWTIALRCRVPGLDRAFDLEKDRRRQGEGEGDEDSILTGTSAGGSIVTWSSVVSESQHLMA